MLYGEKGLFYLYFTARIAVLYSLGSPVGLGGIFPGGKKWTQFELREQVLKFFLKINFLNEILFNLRDPLTHRDYTFELQVISYLGQHNSYASFAR